MANKKKNGVVVKNTTKTKKKKSCCCSCLTAMLIVFVIILGGGIGAGWYFGDKYAKQYLDMSIGDVLGAVKDVRVANEKKIVTNSHNNTNSAEFENALKKQLLLKASAPLNKDTLLSLVLGDSNSGGSQSSTPLNSPLIRALNDNSTEPVTSNPMLDYIATLYSAENIDLDALSAYEESKHSSYVLSFTDKQIAAFISDVIKSQIDGEQFDEQLSAIKDYIGDKKMSEIIIFDQIIFSGTQTSPVIKLTLSIDLRAIASGLIAQQTGYEVGWLSYPLLPKRLFVSAVMNLSDEASLKVYVNNTDDAKMARLYKLIRGITRNTGGVDTGELDLEKQIENLAGETLNKVADSIKKYADLSEINAGKIKFDLFDLAIELAGLNKDKPEEKQLKSSDIMYSLKYLLTSDFESAIKTEYTWKDQYIKTGEVKPTYKPADITDYTLVDYEKKLLNEIADKYLIDLSNGTPDDETDDKTFADLMALFGMGGNGSGDLMDWIDADRLGELSKRDPSDLKVRITDQMLGAMFNAQIATIAGNAGGMSDLAPTVYQTAITKEGGKIFLEAGIALDLSQMLGNDMLSVLSGVLPTRAMISFKMEITPNVADDYEYAESSIMFNDLTDEQTKWLLDTISKFGVDLSIDDLLSPLEDSMRDVITTMKDQMPGLEFETSSLLMADLFSLTMDLVINTDKENPVMYDVLDESDNKTGTAEFTSADLQEVIGELYSEVSTTGFSPIADNHYEFLEDIISKYFLKGADYIDENDPDLSRIIVGTKPDGYTGKDIYINKFEDLTAIFGMGKFDTDLLNLEQLKHTATPTEDLYPVITESNLADIILSMMNGEQFADFTQIESFKIVDKNTIEMVMAINTNSLFNGSNSDFNKFITIDKLYVSIVIHMDKVINDYEDANGQTLDRYKTDITVNNMTAQELAKLNALINHFNSGSSDDALNLDGRAKDIGFYIHDQLNNFKTSMGSNCEFVPGGLKIASIFDVLAESSKDSGGTKPDSEDVRIAIQGLWEKKEGSTNNNFVETKIVFNSPSIPTSLHTVSDNQLAYALTKGFSFPLPFGGTFDIQQMDTVEHVSLVQINLYSSRRTLPNDIWGITYNENSDYAVFTFKLTEWQIQAGNEDNNSFKDFIPKDIFFTLIFERESGETAWKCAEIAENEDFFRVNHLTNEQQNVLLNFAKVDTTSFTSQITNCETILSNYFSGTIGYNQETDTGTITMSMIP